MSTLSQQQRDALPDSAYCDPKNRLFPIIDAADVLAAAHLIGKAENPDAVKACIIAKARARGWPIPKSWQ